VARAAKAAPAAEPKAELDPRGQITVPLDGQDYVLRPSFDAILEIEREVRPLYQLARDASLGALTLDEMGRITAILMRAHGATMSSGAPNAMGHRKANPDKIARMIYEAGPAAICARLMVVLIGATNGGFTPEGEAKAAEAMTEPTPAAE
jgi:hypothetical protein